MSKTIIAYLDFATARDFRDFKHTAALRPEWYGTQAIGGAWLIPVSRKGVWSEKFADLLRLCCGRAEVVS